MGTKAFLHAVVTRADNSVDHFHSIKDFLAEFAKGTEDAIRAARDVFATNLVAHHFDGDGKLKNVHNLGSGLTTNLGAIMLAMDPTWVAASTPFSTLSSLLYVATGTGTTSAAASDYALQTAIANGNLTGATNGYTTGAASTLTAANSNIWQNVCTVSYAATEAVTEYGLFMANGAAFTGTATAASANSLTNSGASFTTAGNGLKGWAVEAASSAINTPTTTAAGVISSNTGTALTIPSWVTLALASASTPSGTTAYVVQPLMWDHKIFSAINVISGDSIQFTYQLTVTPGG